jgi:UDPglucose 6-dehydrogenase
MKLAVVGAGYVGLVTGVCFAETGHHVACLDCDRDKVETLRAGRVPFYEPGLAELLDRNLRAGRLRFTADPADALAAAEIAFLAVGTPATPTGDVDLTAVNQVAESIAALPDPPPLVVIKSTVPVGGSARLQALFDRRCPGRVRVASNPEFLREGAAVNDFNFPDRIVIGTPDPDVAAALKRLYAPFVRTLHPILVMSRESAEMTKYAANGLLASRLSFINEIANLCRALGADVAEVRTGLGFDSRIGLQYLFPGVGYGGSCFPKDVQALARLGRAAGVPCDLLEAGHAVNERQKRQLAERAIAFFGGSCCGRTFALWGLTFKPRTDDLRDAPALTIINLLLDAGAALRVYDPVGLDRARAILGDRVAYASSSLDAASGADALFVITEWSEFRSLDLPELRRRMKSLVIFDGRNMYNRDDLRRAGAAYFSIGQPDLLP